MSKFLQSLTESINNQQPIEVLLALSQMPNKIGLHNKVPQDRV